MTAITMFRGGEFEYFGTWPKLAAISFGCSVQTNIIMSDQVLSSNFVQKVFDTISLEKNMDLWMSEEDVMLKNRIEFLADYPETMFPDYLFNNSKRANLAKNIMLCKGFKTKAEKLEVTENWTQALALYNQSITFAPAEENSLIEHLVCKQNDIMAKIIDRDHSSKDDAANIG